MPGLRLKVCGLTAVRDAEAAVAAGADYLGFIFHPASPRAITRETYRTLAVNLPPRSKVAVTVEPAAADLPSLRAEGFDFLQIHFRLETPLATVAEWSRAVGADRLWLAPKLPPGRDVPVELLPLASTFLLDTFDAEKFGGTGRTGDWGKFARHQAAHPARTWILSGGLNPENAAEAMRVSGARFLDFNSGVESRPGVKDHEKLAALSALKV